MADLSHLPKLAREALTQDPFLNEFAIIYVDGNRRTEAARIKEIRRTFPQSDTVADHARLWLQRVVVGIPADKLAGCTVTDEKNVLTYIDFLRALYNADNAMATAQIKSLRRLWDCENANLFSSVDLLYDDDFMSNYILPDIPHPRTAITAGRTASSQETSVSFRDSANATKRHSSSPNPPAPVYNTPASIPSPQAGVSTKMPRKRTSQRRHGESSTVNISGGDSSSLHTGRVARSTRTKSMRKRQAGPPAPGVRFTIESDNPTHRTKSTNQSLVLDSAPQHSIPVVDCAAKNSHSCGEAAGHTLCSTESASTTAYEPVSQSADRDMRAEDLLLSQIYHSTPHTDTSNASQSTSQYWLTNSNINGRSYIRPSAPSLSDSRPIQQPNRFIPTYAPRQIPGGCSRKPKEWGEPNAKRPRTSTYAPASPLAQLGPVISWSVDEEDRSRSPELTVSFADQMKLKRKHDAMSPDSPTTIPRQHENLRIMAPVPIRLRGRHTESPHTTAFLQDQIYVLDDTLAGVASTYTAAFKDPVYGPLAPRSPNMDPSWSLTAPTDEPELDASSEPSHPKQPAPQNPPGRPLLSSYNMKPLIWAQSRQEVCETLEYFKAYQSGVYFLNDVALGYLLGAFSSKRDAFHHNGRLIVSHGGGKAEALRVNKASGQMEVSSASNQSSDDKSVRALLNTYKRGLPLALLADDRYALFPYNLSGDGYAYVVLGYYWIVDAWAELDIKGGEKVVRYKFAFQWCPEQGEPWWSQPKVGDSDSDSTRTYEVQPLAPTPTSDIAREMQDVVMRQGKTIASLEAQAASEVINPAQTSASTSVIAQYKITLDSPSDVKQKEQLVDRHSAPLRQRCSSCATTSIQVYEQGWMCLNPACSAFFTVNGDDVAEEELTHALSFLSLRQDPRPYKMPQGQCLTPSIPPAGDQQGGLVTTRRFTRGMHCKQCGRLSSRFQWKCWQCKNCSEKIDVHGAIRAPNEFWKQHDELSSKIRIPSYSCIHSKHQTMFFDEETNERLRLQAFELPGGRGTIYIIPGSAKVNGEANRIFRDYQEQAAIGTIDFRRYPLKSHMCRGELLTNYFSQNTGAPYNYVGSASHTVSLENGPSAVQDALSLVRRRIKVVIGKDVPFNEVLSAAYMEQQKMAFHSDSERGLGPTVASLSLGSCALMHFRLHTKYCQNKNERMVLTVVLKHGDILVMDGAGIQECYEHTVIPMNFRMVATCRVISPENYT